MIVYSLICAEGHEFEGWFKDSAAFDHQAGDGSLACPFCGNAQIGKAIMSPSVKASVTKAKGRDPVPERNKAVQYRQFVTGFRKFIEENAENVGPAFPEEARKIYYGETGQRPIYGESTLDEAKALIEEGIDIAPMPADPDELN